MLYKIDQPHIIWTELSVCFSNRKETSIVERILNGFILFIYDLQHDYKEVFLLKLSALSINDLLLWKGHVPCTCDNTCTETASNDGHVPRQLLTTDNHWCLITR